MICSHCGTELPDEASFCSHCGHLARTDQQTQPARATVLPSSQTPDATGGIIPYKNPPALFGYYCGVFSLIPFLGLPIGIVAIPLGILGLRRRRENPMVKGVVHAWTAIILGTLTTILWGGLILLFVMLSLR